MARSARIEDSNAEKIEKMSVIPISCKSQRFRHDDVVFAPVFGFRIKSKLHNSILTSGCGSCIRNGKI